MSTIFDSIGIDPGIVIIVLLIVVLVLIGTTISSNMRLTRLERKYKMFMKGSDAQSLETVSYTHLIGACFSTVSFIEPFISPDKKQQDMEIASMIPILMPSFSLLRLPINNPIDTPIRLPNREIINILPNCP